MDLKKVIDKKDSAAQFMIDEITHICTKFEKRGPGSKGEQQACEYMAEQLKELGCETTLNLESNFANFSHIALELSVEPSSIQRTSIF